MVQECARILWGMAWSSWVEEEHRQGRQKEIRLSGNKVEDIMPPVPPEVMLHAWMLVGKLEQLNGVSYWVLQARAMEVVKDLPLSERDVQLELGASLAYHSDGAGCGWEDDYPQFEIKWPFAHPDISVEYLLKPDREPGSPFVPGASVYRIGNNSDGTCTYECFATKKKFIA